MRILNIDDVDLNLYSFDYDLTLAFVLANADGTVYHRYGGRDHLFPMKMETLLEIMEEGLTSHAAYQKNPNPPEPVPPTRLSELIHGPLQDEIKPVFGCYHCHYVREARQSLSTDTFAFSLFIFGESRCDIPRSNEELLDLSSGKTKPEPGGGIQTVHYEFVGAEWSACSVAAASCRQSVTNRGGTPLHWQAGRLLPRGSIRISFVKCS